MTYHPAYITCDVCHRALTVGFMSELKEGTLSHDGDGKHICDDCSIKRVGERVLQAGLIKAVTVRPGPMSDEVAEVVNAIADRGLSMDEGEARRER